MALTAFAFHAPALNGWWLSDDPQVLVQAVRQSPGDYFFVPQAWQYLSSSNFTPLVTLSFEADLAVAGLAPRFFYLHQIVALALAAVLLFLYLERWTGPIPAVIAGAVFLASPQAILAARTLMVRHYVEGLVLALLSLMLWRLGREKAAATGSVLAATAYLLSMLAKEIYVPLPLFMIFESAAAGEPWKRTGKRLIPVFIAAAGYAFWRLRMLGSIGGYGGEGAGLDVLRIDSIWQAAMGWAHSWTILAFAAGALLVFIAALTRRPGATVAFVVTGILVVLVPIWPVLSQVEARHGFLIFATLAAGIGLGVAAGGYRRPLVASGGAVVLIATLLAGQQTLRNHQSSARTSVAEGRHVWEGRENSPLLLAQSPGWYLGGLAELRARENRGAPPRYLLSDEGLLVEPLDLKMVVTAGAKPLPESVVLRVSQDRARFDPGAPIQVEVGRTGHRVEWSLGPVDTVKWVFLTYPEYDEYAIEPRGSRIIPEPSVRQYFRVMRWLPDGRWTVTPPLALPEPGRTVRWQR